MKLEDIKKWNLYKYKGCYDDVPEKLRLSGTFRMKDFRPYLKLLIKGMEVNKPIYYLYEDDKALKKYNLDFYGCDSIHDINDDFYHVITFFREPIYIAEPVLK